MQTTLMKVYVAWPRIRTDGGNVDAYARRVMVNAHIDETRRPWRRERVGVEESDLEARRRDAAEDRDVLLAALAGLPPRQRATVVLRHYWGLSVEETATRPRGAAPARSRARRRTRCAGSSRPCPRTTTRGTAMTDTFWAERLEELAEHEDGGLFDVRDDVERGRPDALRDRVGVAGAAVLVGAVVLGTGWPGAGELRAARPRAPPAHGAERRATFHEPETTLSPSAPPAPADEVRAGRLPAAAARRRSKGAGDIAVQRRGATSCSAPRARARPGR